MINRFPGMDTYFTEINHVLLAGVYSGKRSTSAGSSGSNFVGFGTEPVYVHLVCVDRSLFFVDTVGILMAWASLLCWSVCVVSS